MTVQQYFEKINKRFQSGISTEHSYRGDLQLLLETLCPNTDVTNEPTRIACGAPDFILTKKGNPNFPIGYIEAKDLLESFKLDTIEKTEQLVRYRGSLNNLILCNYIDFRLFINGEIVTDISIVKIEGEKLIPHTENWPAFENFIKDFAQFKGISIKSALKLTEMMASKARLMQDVLQKALISDEDSQANSSLKDQMQAFKNVLIHDIKAEEFADIYAQTIAYGMFAARLHDTSMDSFTRQEAAELIPKSNPFLKKLFGYIAGVEIDDRIIWIVDALAEVFRSTDVAAILKNFGKATRMEDPMIHFYETFLAVYNPKLRKSRGVWYTPEPVVNFIVRAVDDILKTGFGLPMGLADNSKIKIKRKVANKATEDRRSKIKEVEVEEEVHKVQILDPATGTGTFLAEIIRRVYSNFQSQQGIWGKYVEEHLIPRLHGFELLMASYAMAHLKLDLLLKETGYKPTKKENRLQVYLTNSLEEAHPDTNTLFASWLSQEASEANIIKMETPVMVIIGNPPYSIVSSNLTKKQREAVEKYKYIDNIKIKEKGALQFEKIINDDYVKFIALGESYITKNKEGVLAFINNHNFIDSPQLRGLRYSLAKSFDKIYILDLHGNTTKKETSPDGEKDVNVFDIKQGVSINLFVKTNQKKEGTLAKVFHADCWGLRNDKYKFLSEKSLNEIQFAEVTLKPDNYLFLERDYNLQSKFDSFFGIRDLFIKDSTGVISARDNMVVSMDKDLIKNNVLLFKNSNLPNSALCEKLDISEKKGWDIDKARKRVQKIDDVGSLITAFDYRPFDQQYIFYDESLVWTTARPVMRNLIEIPNLGLTVGKKGQVVGSMQWNLAFITNAIIDFNMFYRGGVNVFPLYLYNDDKLNYNEDIIPNLEIKTVEKICNKLNAKFLIPADRFSSGMNSNITPVDLLDYIYSILHSPNYRDSYKEFLKSDFPRIPYPKDLNTFRQFTAFGSQLRKIHLLEAGIVNKPITKYPVNGDNVVDKIKYSNSKVYINDIQYFEGVSEIAWDFYIGGYQPAQKWLKDRKGRTLTFEEIMHYQKIIAALTETDRIMNEIDKIHFE